MFNIGFTELLAIAAIALIFIGPEQLPEIAKVVGKLMGEFRKATQDLAGGLLDVKRNINTSINDLTEVKPESKKIAEIEKNSSLEESESNEPQS